MNYISLRSKKQLSIAFLILILFVVTAEGVIHLSPKLIQAPDDTSYVVGTSGNELIWIFEAEESEDHPTVYNITIDTILLNNYINNTWFDNVEIVVNIDGLGIGIHIVEITVADNGVPEFAPATKDSVQVTVIENGEKSSVQSSLSNESSDESGVDIMSLMLTSSSLLVTFRIAKGYHKNIKI